MTERRAKERIEEGELIVRQRGRDRDERGVYYNEKKLEQVPARGKERARGDEAHLEPHLAQEDAKTARFKEQRRPLGQDGQRRARHPNHGAWRAITPHRCLKKSEAHEDASIDMSKEPDRREQSLRIQSRRLIAG
eukprot:scaffold177801_cov28-Tisochrysis_lutea.AAC.6